jgi:hypothetical protein
VASILDGLEESIVGRLKVERKGRVNDAPVDVDTDVDLEDVTLLQNCGDMFRTISPRGQILVRRTRRIARVRGVVCSDVV